MSPIIAIDYHLLLFIVYQICVGGIDYAICE